MLFLYLLNKGAKPSIFKYHTESRTTALLGSIPAPKFLLGGGLHLGSRSRDKHEI